MVDRHERSDARRNREALLKAAAEVLAADPSASMDDIAARAGLGRATMYRHVSGRADLLAELSEWALDSARRAVADTDAPGAPDSSDRSAEAGLRHLLERLAIEGAGFRVLLRLDIGSDPRFTTARQQVLQPIADLVRRGKAAGEFRSDLDPIWAVAALIALLQAAVADEREDPARLVWETVVEGWRPAS